MVDTSSNQSHPCASPPPGKDPRFGRHQEGFSTNPMLSARYAAAAVQGVCREVVAVAKPAEKTRGWVEDKKEGKVAEADVVSVHTPLTQETRRPSIGDASNSGCRERAT